MRQADRRTAENVLNIVQEENIPQECCNQFRPSCRNKTHLTLFNEFASCLVRDGSGPNKNFIAIRSSCGAPYPCTNAGRAQKN